MANAAGSASRGAERVAGLVLLDLEAKELVNRLQRLGVGGAQLDTAAALGVRVRVGHRGAQALEGGDSGRDLIVHGRRDVEIAYSKAAANLDQVPADLVAARGVLGGVGFDADLAARGARPAVGRRGTVGAAPPLGRASV